MKAIFVITIIFSISLISQANCFLSGGDAPSFKVLNVHVQKVISEMFVPVMSFSVNKAGKGGFSLQFSDEGEVENLRMEYTDDEGTSTYTVAIKAFNEGESLNYESSSKPGKAIILRKKAGDDLSKTSGGTFQLMLRKDIKKGLYTQVDFELKKVNDKWVIIYQDKIAKHVTLSPGISWLSWDGTFTSYSVKTN